MKKHAIADIIKKGNSAITSEIQGLKKQLQTMQLEAARGELKNRRAGKIIRRTIARLLTAKTLNTNVKDQS